MNAVYATSLSHAATKAPWQAFVPVMTLPIYDRNVITAAYHEAAHAFVNTLIGLPVASAEVDSNGSGVMRFDIERLDRRARFPIAVAERSQIMKEAALLFAAGLYAGKQAELLLHCYPQEGYLSLNDSDHQRASEFLHESYGEDIPIYEAQRLARAILQHHWPAIQALAARLNARGRITTVDVLSVLPAALPHHADLLALLPHRQYRGGLLLW